MVMKLMPCSTDKVAVEVLDCEEDILMELWGWKMRIGNTAYGIIFCLMY